MTSEKKDTAPGEEGKAEKPAPSRVSPMVLRMIDWTDGQSLAGAADPAIELARGFHRLLDRADLAPKDRSAALVLFDALLDALLAGDPRAAVAAAAHLIDRGHHARRVGAAGPGRWIEALKSRLPTIQAGDSAGAKRIAITLLHVDLCLSDDRAAALDIGETIELIGRELPPGAVLSRKVLLNIASELAARSGAFDCKDPKAAKDKLRKHFSKGSPDA